MINYSRRQFLRRVGAAGSVALVGGPGIGLSAIAQKSRLVTIRPLEYASAFANPLKGFRPDIRSPDGGSGLGLDNPLVTVARHYLRWNQIEDSAADGVDKILEFCNPRWAGIEKRNLKIIPRVYLYWPDKNFWPRDLRGGDYGSRKFLYRLAKFIAKLGAAWNKDGRIAYVETGIVGPCGEQWNPTIHAELKQVIGDSYVAAFPDKLCMIRYPWQWPDYQFGVFWDSWGCNKDTARMLEVLDAPDLKNSWKTRVRGGEIPYGFGDPPGLNPNDTMTNPHHVDWVECLTRRGHWNHLGWVAEYDWRNPATTAAGQKLHKGFGYRFVVEEINYPATLRPGETLDVSFSVRNIGASPFYYQWPVVVCLLDEQTHACVWQKPFDQVDIRKWFPGDGWQQFAKWDAGQKHFARDDQPARYEIPPALNEVHGQFVLPSELRRGTYILALAILDPASQKPACRFATENYFNGGYHPVGRIGVGRPIDNPELPASCFVDLAADTTIGYSLKK